MSEEAIQEVLDSLAKIGKHWELGGSVARVWGFLLFRSDPVTQREIEEGTGYSRGLISRCLVDLKEAQMIEVSSEGRENHYTAKTSLIEGHSKFLKRFLTYKIDPMIDVLSKSADTIEDEKVKETFRALLHEYKKLKLAVLIFYRIFEDINLDEMVKSIGDIEAYVQQTINYKGGCKNGK